MRYLLSINVNHRLLDRQYSFDISGPVIVAFADILPRVAEVLGEYSLELTQIVGAGFAPKGTLANIKRFEVDGEPVDGEAVAKFLFKQSNSLSRQTYSVNAEVTWSVARAIEFEGQ